MPCPNETVGAAKTCAPGGFTTAVGRATDRNARPGQHVGVNHRRAHVRMPRQITIQNGQRFTCPMFLSYRAGTSDPVQKRMHVGSRPLSQPSRLRNRKGLRPLNISRNIRFRHTSRPHHLGTRILEVAAIRRLKLDLHHGSSIVQKQSNQ